MNQLTNIDLKQNQIISRVMQKLAIAPVSPTPVEGQEYYDTVTHLPMVHNGTTWVGMGGTMSGADIVTAINGSASIIDGDNLPNEIAALQALADTAGFVKKTGNGAYSIDTATYGTSNVAVANIGSTAETVGGAVDNGVATSAARSDHKHAITNPAIDTLAAATDNTTRDASTTAHGLVVKATAPAAGLVNFVGIFNAETAYTNKPLFDATVPLIDGTAAVGTATVAARRDHVHPTDTTRQAAGNELAALQALADTAGFVKKTGDGAYSIDTSTYGTSNLAVADLTGTAETLGGSAVVGVAASAARSDHKHSITNPSIESLAAATDVTTLNATTSAHGLVVKAVAPASTMINVVGIGNGETAYTNKALFDSTNPAGVGAASPGTSTIAARRDHVHADSLSHSQNTDTGTSSGTFMVGTGGPKVKNSSGEVQMRDNADTGYADLRVKNLVVEGTTTTINSNTVNIGDAEILLNADITTNAGNSDGGIAVKRLMADNTTPKNALLTFNNSTGKWQATQGAVAGTLITTQIATKVTAAIGDNAATSFVITHNLNSRDLNVLIRETASTYAMVMADVAFTTVDTITVSFAVAPTASQYTVTIIG